MVGIGGAKSAIVHAHRRHLHTASRNHGRLTVGATVAILGLGGVGLSAVLDAHVAGASRIVGIDINENKLRLARELGATDTFNARDPKITELVMDATAGGAQYAFEMSGVPAAMATAYSVVRRGGAVIFAGLADLKDTFAIPLAGLVSDERAIIGSYMGSCVPQRDIPRFIEL